MNFGGQWRKKFRTFARKFKSKNCLQPWNKSFLSVSVEKSIDGSMKIVRVCDVK